MMERKKELRRQVALLKTRHSSSATRQSAEILAALEAHPAFRAATTVLLYHSLKDEVDTHEIYPEVEPRKADTASGSCR